MAQSAPGFTRRNLLLAIVIATATLIGTTSAIAADDAAADAPPLEWDVEETEIAIILEPAADRPGPTGLARMAGRFADDLLSHLPGPAR